MRRLSVSRAQMTTYQIQCLFHHLRMQMSIEATPQVKVKRRREELLIHFTVEGSEEYEDIYPQDHIEEIEEDSINDDDLFISDSDDDSHIGEDKIEERRIKRQARIERKRIENLHESEKHRHIYQRNNEEILSKAGRRMLESSSICENDMAMILDEIKHKLHQLLRQRCIAVEAKCCAELHSRRNVELDSEFDSSKVNEFTRIYRF